MQLAEMFGEYTGETFSYSAKYPMEFAPASAVGELDVLDKYLMLLGGSITPEIKRTVAEMATRVALRDLPVEQLNTALASIKELTDDQLKSNAADAEFQEIAE